VGRIRYIGIVLYDAERVGEAASVKDDKDLYESQLNLILDPHDPEIIKQAKIDGIADDWIEAAQRSPIYKLLKVYKVALPLHPEYRTLPMVWYVPPLSPMLHVFGGEVTSTDPNVVFPTINQFRIPIEYLANLLTAGDTKLVETVLQKLVAMRGYMRQIHLGTENPDTSMLDAVGLSEELTRELYDLSAIAKYSDRYVIPLSHKEYGGNMHEGQGAAGYAHQETYTASCSVGEEREDLYYFDEGYWKDLNGNG
jgi:nitrate reductase beta subunit